MKKISMIALAITLCLILAACGSLIEPIDYSQNGLKITLDTSYKQAVSYGYTTCYQSSVATVYLLREEFSDKLSADLTLEEYVSLILAKNGLEESLKEGEYYSFTYETVADEIHLTTLVAMYKMSDCFWTVQFVCNSEYFDKLSVDFERFADSVKDVKVAS